MKLHLSKNGKHMTKKEFAISGINGHVFEWSTQKTGNESKIKSITVAGKQYPAKSVHYNTGWEHNVKIGDKLISKETKEALAVAIYVFENNLN